MSYLTDITKSPFINELHALVFDSAGENGVAFTADLGNVFLILISHINIAFLF